MLHLSAIAVAGRRYWIASLLPLTWVGFQVFRLLVGWREEAFEPASAQNVLIGFPLTILAIGLGVRIIAAEVDRRTLEIAFTVPGGTQRVWTAKLIASAMILLVAELLLALTTFVFCTEFPPGALYGAFQSAICYLVLAMALSALSKSEATGALVTAIVFVMNLVVQPAQLRISPFWNPEAQPNADPADLLAWTTQNRIGMLLVIAALTALAFARAERREKLLGG